MVRDLVKQLRQEREVRGLTQLDVANKIGLTRQAVAASENGHSSPGLDTLARWAQALNLRLEVRFVPAEVVKGEGKWQPVHPATPAELQKEPDDLAVQVTRLAASYQDATPAERAAVRAVLALLADRQ